MIPVLSWESVWFASRMVALLCFVMIPLPREVKMAKDLEDELTEAIMELLLDAKEQGLGIKSFEDVCKMMGVDDMSLLSKYEQNLAFDLNTEYLEKMKDPDVRQAMIE